MMELCGGETIWPVCPTSLPCPASQAVCRGVPTITIPTANHSEQLLNASVHARNFPLLVRKRQNITKEDIEWLVDFDLKEKQACAESLTLRTLVGDFLKNGSPLLQ